MKRVKIAELLDILEEVEGRRITEAGLRKSLSRAGVYVGKDHKVDLDVALEARKAAREMDKTNISAKSTVKMTDKKGVFAESYPEARIKQIEKQCEKIDIEIAKARKQLVNRREAETEYKRELTNMRKVIDDWESHETAKHPEHAEKITALAERLIEQIKDRCERD